MKHNIIAAAILGLCLILTAAIVVGRYHFVRVNECAVARGDRWTGKVEMVRVSNDEKRCSVFDTFPGG